MEHTLWIKSNFQLITLSFLAILLVLVMKKQIEIKILSQSVKKIEANVGVVGNNQLSAFHEDLGEDIAELEDNVYKLTQKVDSLKKRKQPHLQTQLKLLKVTYEEINGR